jgi:hypothetical protein
MWIGIDVRVSTPNHVQHQAIEQQLDRVRRHLAERGGEPAAEHTMRDDGYTIGRMKAGAAQVLIPPELRSSAAAPRECPTVHH